MAQTEIDAFYDKIIRGLPDDEIEYLANRAPASTGNFSPNSVLNPLGTEMKVKQIEPTTVITPQIINPVPGLKYPIAETLRQNLDDSLLQRENTIRELRSDIPDLNKSLSGSMKKARAASDAINAPTQDYKPDAGLEKQYAKAQEDAAAPINADRDLLTEAILSFGPALGGLALGENAQIGNQEVGKNARAIYEAQRKEKLDFLQKGKEDAAKRVEAIQKLKQSDRDSFDKKQERELNRLKAIADSNLKFAEMDSKQLDTAIKQYTDAQKGFSDAFEKGAEAYAKVAETPEKEAGKEERAKIMANLAQQKMNQPTQGERDASARYGRAMNSAQNLEALGANSSKYPALNDQWFSAKADSFKRGGPVNYLIQNMVKDPNVRAAITAETEWGQNFLRDETGAAIKDEELPQELNKVFPRYGDSPEVIAQKASIRKQYENGLLVQMGRAQAPKIEAPIKAPRSEMSKNQSMSLDDKRKALKARGYK